ncbi:MAG: DUF6434 domain-containing protein [Janthinobacterium svalbardensis]
MHRAISAQRQQAGQAGRYRSQLKSITGTKARKNVRRFLSTQCGPYFKFDRELMAWVRKGVANNMGDVVDEWKRRSDSREPAKSSRSHNAGKCQKPIFFTLTQRTAPVRISSYGIYFCGS